ncbi:MAG: hypothetical protein PGN13_07200 [Patulibacter minatonensis]
MRVIDLSTFPDRHEHRAALEQALAQADLGDGRVSDPIDVSAATAVALPDDLPDDEVRAYAEELRRDLEGSLDEDVTVVFQLADPQADTAGGAPDHLE